MPGSGKLLGNVAGVFRGADFRLHRARGQGMLPTFLIYQVTRKCNSKCSFCSIWKQDHSNELTVEELRKLFSDPFFSEIRWINLTGGEPFIRKDLAEVARVMHEELPSLLMIAIPTNGFGTSSVLKGTKELLEVLKGQEMLSVNVSIDGIGEAHETSRGVPGCFNRAMATLKGLLELAKENKRLEVGTEVVITSANIDDLKDIYEYLAKYTNHINFTPVIVAPSEYYGKPDKDLGLSDKDIAKMQDFFDWLKVKLPAYAYYFEKVLDIKLKKRGGKRTFPCLGGYKTMFMDSKGEIYPCLIAPSHLRLGSVRETPPGEIWFSDNANLMRRALKKWKYCQVCTNNCDILNNLKEETIDLLWFMAKNPRIFAALLKDLRAGKMDKYL
jgi:radical SAM protein with 4Fe4S-binding SPASM domain